MSQDVLHEESPPEAARPSGGPGRLVLAGVVGACTLGACLGFWARPGEPGRAALAHPTASKAPEKALEIVVADQPLTPSGQPLEVLPQGKGQASAMASPPPMAPPVEPLAPHRAASGLVRVDAPVAAQPPPPAAVAFAPPARVPDLKAAARLAEQQRAAARQAEQRRIAAEQAQARADAEQREQDRLAERRAAAQRAHQARLAEQARQAEADRIAEQRKQARLAEQQRRAAAHKATARAEAQAAEHDRAAKAEAARLAKLEKQQAEQQARAEKAAAARQARLDAAREKARQDAKAARMAALVRALRSAPRRIAAEAHQLSRNADLQLATAAPTPRAAAPKPRPTLAKAACASSDPGEAMVCSDSRLSARDRELQQAYRNAEAAGVSPDALRRQQSRWLQARAAAAREDRWAVEDVYEARIAELKELTRDRD